MPKSVARFAFEYLCVFELMTALCSNEAGDGDRFFPQSRAPYRFLIKKAVGTNDWAVLEAEISF
jgi:hypothetical protein